MARMKSIIPILLALSATVLAAQRPVARSSDWATWEIPGSGDLSPHGEWVAHEFRRANRTSELRHHTIANASERVVRNSTGATFTSDNRWPVYTIAPDTAGRDSGSSAPVQAGASRAGLSLVPIRIETTVGNIDAELDSARAPATVANFLRYVDARLYDNGSFFRVVRMDNQPNDSVRIEVIQGGIAKEHRAEGFPAIALERTSVTSLRHVDGTLSMARGGPDSATDQFFIVFGSQPELDFGGRRNKDGQGFAAFGRVTKGLDVARIIQSGAANAQTLVAPITITRIARR